MVNRVLVVDDDLEVSLLVRKVLESRGIAVTTAPNGREALRIAERDTPDLIFLDVMMPGMDGATTLAELRRRPGLNATRVVMLTAQGPREAPELHRVGADGYVTKPFTMKELLKTLD